MGADKKNYNVEPNPDEKVEKTYEAFKGELALKVEKENGRVPDFSYFYEQNREKDTGGVKETHIEETQQQYSPLPYQMATGVIRSVPESISASKQPNEMRLNVRNRHEENNSQATALDEMRNDSTSEVLYGDHDAVETNDPQLTTTVAETNGVVESVEILEVAKPIIRRERKKSVDEQLIDVLRKMVSSDASKTLFFRDIYDSFLSEYNYTQKEFGVQNIANRVNDIAEMYEIQHTRKYDTERKENAEKKLSAYTGFQKLLDDIES